MANKSPQDQGSLTQKADSRSKRIADISNVSRTINEMQKRVNQEISSTELNTGDYQHIQEVQNSMIKVLSSLSHTITQIGRGFIDVAEGTAKVGKNVFSQYGKAISEDISYNKKNIIAMALARSTPLFGYFAAKFMETDVFKSAAEKIKTHLSNALSGVALKFKEGFRNIFIKNKPKKSIYKTAATIPKMQKGGIVKKEGLAYLHSAEVVTPIKPLLEKIDQSISVTKELASINQKAQLKTLSKMDTYVGKMQHTEKVGLFKGFTKALNEVYSQHTEPANIRMLRAVLSIQDSLGATVGTWPQVWQKMLITHPTFRKIMFSLNQLRSTIGMPIKLVYHLFKKRGGYPSDLSKSKNPMEAAAYNIGILYTGSMHRLDNIALYTQAIAGAVRDLSSFVTGKKYPIILGLTSGQWSITGILRSGLNKFVKGIFKGAAFSEGLLEKAILGKKGLTSKTLSNIGDILTREREFPSFKTHKKRLKQTLSGLEPTYFHNIIPQLSITREVELPVTDLKLLKLFKEQKQIAQESVNIIDGTFRVLKNDEKNEKKFRKLELIDQKKKLGLFKDLVKVEKKSFALDKKRALREKIQAARDKMKNIFSRIKGFIGTILPFLPSLFKKIFGGSFFTSIIKGLTSSIPKVLVSLGKNLFKSTNDFFINVINKIVPKGFFSVIGNLARSVSKFLVNPIVLKFLSMAGLVAGAAYGGWKIGKKLDKWMGISKHFQNKINEWDKKATRLANTVSSQQLESLRTAKKSGAKGLQNAVLLKLQSQLGSATGRESDLGYFGRANQVAIDAAQRKFMAKNINQYMAYDPDEVARIRNEWLEKGGWWHKAPGTISAEKYGIEREKAFLKYLQKHGKKLTEFEYTEALKTHNIHAKQLKHNISTNLVTEKTASIYKDIKDIARVQAETAITQAKVITEEIKRQGKITLEKSKELNKTVATGFQQSSNIITSSVQNISNVFGSNNNNFPSISLSPQAKNILRGNVSEENISTI